MPKLFLTPALILSVLSVNAQSPSKKPADQELFRTIEALDNKLFDAYNRCELEKFAAFFPEELEFYHDNGGLTDRTRESLVASIKKNICGQVNRKLVPGTLEVYPMHGYGALEIGVHRFSHPGKDDTEPNGEGKFVMLWQNKDGAWKITRVISYDHHTVGK